MVALSKGPRFPLGQVVATPRALEALAAASQNVMKLLRRHAGGDWGDVCKSDAVENDLALRRGLRVLSIYTLSTGVRLWIITESDRSGTCILLPEEY